MSEIKSRRGFASCTPERQREIASAGGKAAHKKGTGHEWTTESAREAGKRGGLVTQKKRRDAKDATRTE